MDAAHRHGDNGAVSRSRLWFLPVMLAVLVGGGWYFGFRALANDRELPVYVQGAERMVAGEEVYRRGADAKPFTYPPFAALPFVPMLPVPDKWQPPVWFACNFLLLLVLARWLHGWAKRPQVDARPQRLWLFWGGTLLVGGHHVISVFTNQSHDLLIAAAVLGVAWGCCRGGRAGWLGAGFAAGAGGALKATPLLFLELFALRRRWLAIVGLVVAVAGLSLLPDLFYPRADGRLWSVAWFEINVRGIQVGGAAQTPGIWDSHSFLNQSLSGALVRLFSPPPAVGTFTDTQAMLVELPAGMLSAVSLVLKLLVVALIAVGVLAIGKLERLATDRAAVQRTFGLAAAGMIACGMLLLSPMSSKSHFCVCLFPAAFLIDRLLRGPRDLLLLLLVLLAFALGPLCSKGILGRELGNRMLAIGNVAWSTAFLLLGLVRACRAELRRHLPSAAGAAAP